LSSVEYNQFKETRRVAIIISPRAARRYLRDINESHLQFRTWDGKTIKNLIELACYLKGCSDEAFRYHVSRDYNHFSNWVENVVLDQDLSRQMSLVLDRNPMRLIITKRVNILVFHATRKTSGREKAAMILEKAQLPEEHFVTNSGMALRDIWELKEFLETAHDHTVYYHHAPPRNDFAEWVGEVLLDFELADRLKAAFSREELARMVSERISQLEAFKVGEPKRHRLQDYAAHVRGEPHMVRI